MASPTESSEAGVRMSSESGKVRWRLIFRCSILGPLVATTVPSCGDISRTVVIEDPCVSSRNGQHVAAARRKPARTTPKNPVGQNNRAADDNSKGHAFKIGNYDHCGNR